MGVVVRHGGTNDALNSGAPYVHAQSIALSTWRHRQRQADRAGQRLFRELVPSDVCWATAREARQLVGADLVAVLMPIVSCAHPPPCEFLYCRRALAVKAILGNRNPDFPGRRFATDAGVAAQIIDGHPVVLKIGSDADSLTVAIEGEGLVAAVALPVLVGDLIGAVLLVGSRGAATWGADHIEMLGRLGVFAGSALGAAREHSRAEEVAVIRERRRMANELHDTVGQLLYGIGVAARLARESASTGRADLVGRLQALEQQIGRTTGALRHALRSLDGASGARAALVVSMNEAIEAFRHRTGIACQLLVLGESRGVGIEREQLLLRVASEGLRNVERHSRAREVVVSLSFEPQLIVVAIQDDGAGPCTDGTDGTGLGLARLREECRVRGGELVLLDNEDGGATLRAWLDPSA